MKKRKQKEVVTAQKEVTANTIPQGSKDANDVASATIAVLLASKEEGLVEEPNHNPEDRSIEDEPLNEERNHNPEDRALDEIDFATDDDLL